MCVCVCACVCVMCVTQGMRCRPAVSTPLSFNDNLLMKYCNKYVFYVSKCHKHKSLNVVVKC